MPGKIYAGNIETPRDKNLGTAYCEGRQVSYAGGIEADNPHAEITSEAYIAWDLGFKSDSGGLPLPQDNCALPPRDNI